LIFLKFSVFLSIFNFFFSSKILFDRRHHGVSQPETGLKHPQKLSPHIAWPINAQGALVR